MSLILVVFTRYVLLQNDSIHHLPSEKGTCYCHQIAIVLSAITNQPTRDMTLSREKPTRNLGLILFSPA